MIANTTGGPKSQIQFQNMWHAVDAHSTETYRGTVNVEKKLLEKKPGEKCPRHNYCYTIDFDVTPHLLRHAYITNLILAGVNIKTGQYLASHADPKVTPKPSVYAQFTPKKHLISTLSSGFFSISDFKYQNNVFKKTTKNKKST